MINLIFAIKFVHVLAAAAMAGAWFAMAVFMLFAHRSGNPSVLALVARFVVGVEMVVMIPALALQPLTGFPLAWAIGLAPLDEFWIVVSLALFCLVVAGWFATLRLEMRIRRLTQEAALAGAPVPETYGRLFRLYSTLVWPTLAGMTALFALMIWQPRLD
ncbi:MAG TPA: DUF2269 domain-containing protein [Xanthobacteraceae bacterium]|nr:DUF2269 domain-containing protein [Xanthobacteraceae bacterium]